MMRATTLKASTSGLDGLLSYYAGLAADHARRDGVSRGPIDYYLDPAEPPGRWWGHGCAILGLDGEVRAEQLEALLTARHPGRRCLPATRQLLSSGSQVRVLPGALGKRTSPLLRRCHGGESEPWRALAPRPGHDAWTAAL